MNKLISQVKDFDYKLPPELIAQRPAPRRTDSRLLVVERSSGTLSHQRFRDLPEYLISGDTLVLNETQVRPARLRGVKTTGAKVELLLLREVEPGRFSALARPAKRLPPGSQVHFKAGLRGEIIAAGEAGERLVELTADGPLTEALAKAGELALPPYIRETQADESRYQTVYAAKSGSAAAPTAGLHFTQELLDQLTDARVNTARLSLDIGLDTFRPMSVAALDDHQMHAEDYSIGATAVQQLRQARESGGRLLAVGTTTVRALESWAVSTAAGQPGSYRTDLFIRPGFDFQLTDMMLTNFHLPRSTLLVMVSAFAGSELIKQAYQAAIEAEYRFYSFGDAMLIL